MARLSHFDMLETGNYVIRMLNGKFFTGKNFARDKSKAKSFTFEKVHSVLKKIRDKGIAVTFEKV